MTTAPLVEAIHLEKHFPLPRTARESIVGAPRRAIHAVDDVSFTILPGETVGLIGESGSGKTTLGWLIARLHEATGGSLRFAGEDILALHGAALRRWRRNAQIVFQDPVGSLDPRLKVWQIVGEPIRAQGEHDRGVVRSRVRELLPTVGLPPDCLDQYPHEFSGGGRQRLSLARALSVDPRLIVLDEPTSALDVAVQAQILNRLVELQRERPVAYLLITHNVAAVRYAADRVAVMYLGRIVELGGVRSVLETPLHPYTKALLAAVPVADARRRRTRFRIGGDVPSLIDPPPGCRFAPRCPFVIDRCRAEYPPLREIPESPGQWVACHRAEEVRNVRPAELLSVGEPAAAAATPTP
ncbi:MAG TPA: ABC transporter ATP-binding protein [Thermoplasmata archaeon]|nr:ABC transporter ATP-binding protein [Thermoplasmata archaeon]